MSERKVTRVGSNFSGAATALRAMPLLATLIISACGGYGSGGGSGEPPPPVQESNGRFNAGGVKGVHYATSTRSGETDAMGTFKFLPGETVAFSVGPITLGSAPGAPEITPFTLAGVTPPTTELELRHELDRMTRGATPFTRAANIEMLLMALDSDHDPANGIDVSANLAGIPATGIDLGLTYSKFAEHAQFLGPEITRAIPLARPLVQIFKALDIVIPAHGKTREDVVTGTTPVTRVTRWMLAADGARVGQSVDSNNDGVLESASGFAYGALGRVSNVDLRIKAIQSPDISLSAVAFDYDVAGNLRGTVERDDFGEDGVPEFVAQRHIVRDARGHVTSDITESDTDGDGRPDHRLSDTFEWDARDNQVRDTQISDTGEGTAPLSRTVTTTEYDASDRITRLTTDSDDDADGTVDRRTTETMEYGAGALPTTVVTETVNLAGTTVNTRTTTTSTYDADGNVLSNLAENDVNGDGVIDARQKFETTYDTEHRVVTQHVQLDNDGDGRFEYSSRTLSTYNIAGSPRTQTTEIDVGNDGTIDTAVARTCEYGTGGELLHCQLDSASGGGVDPARSSTTTATQEPFADGVLVLAQEYLGVVN